MELDGCTHLNKVAAAKAKGKELPVQEDIFFTWTDYDERPGIWTNNATKLEEWYYKLINRHNLYETEGQKEYICQDTADSTDRSAARPDTGRDREIMVYSDLTKP